MDDGSEGLHFMMKGFGSGYLNFLNGTLVTQDSHSGGGVQGREHDMRNTLDEAAVAEGVRWKIRADDPSTHLM